MHFLCLILALAVGVSCSDAGSRSSSGSGASDKKDDDSDLENDSGTSKTSLSGSGVSMRSLGFGPYGVKDQPANNGGIALEYGYISMRQIKSSEDGFIFDYRWNSMAGAAGDSLFSSMESGCEEVKSLKANGEEMTVTASGSLSGSLDLKSGSDQLGSKDSSSGGNGIAMNPEKKTSIAIAGSQTESFDMPDIPGKHNVQLMGAYAGSLNVNTIISVINSNLANEENDLMIVDKGKSEGYDTVVVHFFGGKEADLNVLRCVLPAGGSLTLTESEYKKMIPLKGFVSMSAKVETDANSEKLKGNSSFWLSAILGEGVEDLSIP